ncbi:hypothetical protein P3X46_018427 [Hevea brasiliensis]|uniref:Uncharacterized protein n=1 Tax=Hevea brasiliensis TaxID=3981 RepID=A0ABQ9LS00_HEVBR|nr:UPF0481 protein At3g47200 [Hevea brasiliensis]KAJ9170310.1 hypothetical protein P3X46_018427 [Hevea brasiliensis]
MSNLPGTRNQEIGETPSQHVMISIPAEGEVNEKLLLHSLMEEVPKLLKKSAGKNPCSIFRVPQSLLKIHPEAFHPQIVSIGPYHHGKEHLQMIQEHKRRFLDAALSRAQEFGNGFDDFYKAIAKKKEKIREYYSESTDKYSDHELIEMMIVDGCFIIEVLCIAGGLVQFEEGDSIFSLPWIPFSLMRDFVRLENQIPIFVLENLYELSILASEAEDLPSLTELILKFFDHTFSRPEAVLEKYKNLGGKHLLDLFRSTFVQDLKQPQEVPKDVDHGEFLRLIQPVAKLQVAGVEINPSSPAAESFLDIKFRRYGVLEIPHLSIDEFFSTFLINCVAFEQCYKHGSTHFTSYVIFMSCLNNAPIDAGYLRDRKIIENFFGTDKELVKFFNQVSNGTIFEIENSYLGEVFMGVNQYYFNDWHVRWAGFKYTYFDSPWAFLSALAALVLLILTVIQSFFAVYGYVNPP